MIAMGQIKADELADELGTDRATIRGWVQSGLPTAKKRPLEFDRDPALDWWTAMGLVEVEQVATTRYEIAQHLGVTVRTVSNWIKDHPTFPGRSGTPGRRDGYFPVEEIRRWMAARGLGREDDELGIQIKTERLRRMRLENDRIAASLISRSAVDAFTGKATEITRSTLEAMRVEFANQMPSTITRKQRSSLIGLLDQRIETAIRIMANGFNRDEEEPAMK